MYNTCKKCDGTDPDGQGIQGIIEGIGVRESSDSDNQESLSLTECIDHGSDS